MPINIDDLLRAVTSHGASDLHLKAGALPMMRNGGELLPIANTPRLRPEDTLEMSFGDYVVLAKSRSLKSHQKWISPTEFEVSVDFAPTFFSNGEPSASL